MSTPNNFFPSNLKYLRSRRGLSQEAIAKALDFTRAKYSSLEMGNVKTFSAVDLNTLSDFFRVTIDTLLKLDLAGMGDFRARQYIDSEQYVSGRNLRILAKTVDSNNRENVELVSKKGQAGYADNYNDPEFIGSLERFNLPMLSENRSYRMFPIEGRSMYPFPESAKVVGELVVDFRALNEGALCIVVLRNVQQILFKAVYKGPEDTGGFILRSWNIEYPDQWVAGEDILELWKFHSYWTEEIPQRTGTIEQLHQQVLEMRMDLSKLINEKR